jgi:microcystin-dependent protein
MARDGNGNYSLPVGNPVVTGTTISSTTHNNTTSDMASALTQSLSKDGQTAPTDDLQMASFKHTAVGAAEARDQYATAGQVQDGELGYLTSVAGTNTITAATALGIDAYSAGQVFTFIPANSNTDAATLNVDGLGAVAIWFKGVALVKYELIKNCPVTVMYDGTRFHLINGAYGGDGVPIGVVEEFAGGTLPGRRLFPYGQAVSRVDYAELFGAIGTTFGTGDGSTTFNLPDKRGRAAFGKDDMGGSAANRITNAISAIVGTTLGAAGGNEAMHGHVHTGTTGTQSANHVHSGTTSNDGSHQHGVPCTDAGGSGTLLKDGNANGDTLNTNASGSHTHTITTGTESASHTHSITTATAGAGSSQNIPPAIIMNFMIKW